MPYAPRQKPQADVTVVEAMAAIRRRKGLIGLLMALSIGVGILVSHFTRKQYSATAKLLVVQHPDNFPEQTEQNYAAPTVESMETQLSLIQSDEMYRRAVRYAQAVVGPEAAPFSPTILQSHTVINNPKDSSIMDVVVYAENPDTAAMYANAMANAFVEWKRDVARGQVKAIADSLQAQTDRAHADLLTAEAHVQTFKQAHNIDDLADHDRALVDQLTAREQEVADLQNELNGIDSRISGEAGQLRAANQAVRTDGAFRNDSMIESMQEQLQTLETQRADIASRFRPDYPGAFTAVDASIKDTQERLAQAVSGVLDRNKPSLASQATLYSDFEQTQLNRMYTAAKLAAAQDVLRQTEVQQQEAPSLDSGLARLSREVDVESQIYTSLLGKLTAARLDQDRIAPDVLVTAPAAPPPEAAWPNTRLNIAMSLFLGFFLSLLGVVYAEQRDSRLHDAAQIAAVLPAPVIGEIPALSRELGQALERGDQVPAFERACELACARLSLLVQDGRQTRMVGRHVILVTSVLPGEGKSAVASHFARTLANLGKRTLLIQAGYDSGDAAVAAEPVEDSLSSGLLRLSSLPGTGISPISQTVRIPGIPTLSLLPLRELVSRSSSSSIMPHLSSVLGRLGSDVDVVVIDTPACSVSGDAYFAASFADCVVLVVRVGATPQGETLSACEALASSRPSALAVVANHASMRVEASLRTARPRVAEKIDPDKTARLSIDEMAGPDTFATGSRVKTEQLHRSDLHPNGAWKPVSAESSSKKGTRH